MPGNRDGQTLPPAWFSPTGIFALGWTHDADGARLAATAADRAVMQAMLPRRSAEFSMGRFAARAALAGLGVHDQTLGRLPSGAPDWPTGWTGSITHSQGLAIACAGSTKHVRGIGVDIEPDFPLPREAARAFAHDRFIGPAVSLRASGSRVAFSARESAFKALSAMGRRTPILAMGVTVSMKTPDSGRFVVDLGDGTAEKIDGRWRVFNDAILMTIVVVPTVVPTGERAVPSL